MRQSKTKGDVLRELVCSTHTMSHVTKILSGEITVQKNDTFLIIKNFLILLQNNAVGYPVHTPI